MLIDKYDSVSIDTQLAFSYALIRVPGFVKMVNELIFETQEQLMNLDEDQEDFKTKYRTFKLQLHEYQGFQQMLDNQPE